jgi:hypothetical protein
MTVSMTVVVSVIVLVQECSTDEIQGQTDAAYDQHQLRVLHVLQ